jgi:predicted peptidase
MKLHRLLLALLLPTLLIGCAAQHKKTAPSEQQLLRLSYVSQVDNQPREYFVFLPKGYADQPATQWPLMMFLHGNGERGNGLDELDYVLSHGPLYEAWIQKKDLPFVMIVPQLHMFDMDKRVDYIAQRTPAQIPQRLAVDVAPRDTLFPTVGPMRAGEEVTDMSAIALTLPVGWDQAEQDLLAMLDHVGKAYAVDPQRVYLSGLSYGGFGTWYMASRHPDRFAAIAPVVGWGHPDLMAPIAQAKLPVWAFAAGRDTAVDKKFFYAGLNRLEELSTAEVRFTIHEDMAHDAWRRIYAGDDLYTWLLNYRLRSANSL